MRHVKDRYKIAFAVMIISLITSCGKESELLIETNPTETEISEIKLSTPTLVYGEKSFISFDVKDETEISHVTLRAVIDNATVFENIIPVVAKEKSVNDSIMLPFKEYSLNKDVKIEVEALNKALKTTVKSTDFRVLRSEFEKLFFVDDNGVSYELNVSDEPNVYKISGDFGEKLTGFIYSEPNRQGYKWGFDPTTNKGALASETPFELEDNESSSIKEISFDVVSFTIAPLKKVISVNGVEFLTSPDNPDLKTAFVTLTNNSELNLEQINLNEIMFDPVFFKLENDKVIYTGNTGSCKLYLHTNYNFVFVENDQSKLSGTGDLYINGWGIAWPDLWYNHPDWDFDKAIILTKRKDNSYDFTVVVSKWATFKFYTEKDWDEDIDPTQITYTNNLLEGKEEDGKPGNYNIYYNPQSESETIIIRVSYNNDTRELSAEILKEL